MATMPLKADPAGLLARTPLFGGLDEASRKAVAGELREAAYEPGQVIFSRGDPGSELHIVSKGRIRLSVLTSDGRELSFAHVEPPSIFGELAIFDGRPRSADATAVNRVETLMLSKAAFVRLMESRLSIGEAALRFLAGRLRDADEQLEAIALHPIEARLARFFLASVRQKDPEGRAEKISLALPISQSELALLVGASRPKVNAALGMLESEGAIERRGQQVICDIAALSGIGRVDEKD
ncbi:Crp/Fnr family transcriptional regulator [Hyphomicrobium sp.]|uniref:Crp/Fnr family transcriptional regulator n=1 Tax=Hyphomicrobium sp. TaxID=82 RepID=UPI002CE8DAC7|nr:Crp/Fnr family transcriptional regulator [Hyphomicrobium sp.]HVZ04458.1 Crp/Fnr family transcriptional regulator [Hyphomicrobium sp.]